ncbi:MAG: 50S ribosomal protein L21 [Synergistaceae bacterium]|nr:50S ribosomal protein L21 [Synergistaceae bacterium]
MYAVVETGGKQYRVQEGDLLNVELLRGEPGDEVILDKVLMKGKDDSVEIGKPYIEGASVKAEIVEFGRNDKILVFKYKSKKNIRKMQGHRQDFVKIRITEVI